MILNGRWTVCCWFIIDIATGWVSTTQVITGAAPPCRLSYFSWDWPNCRRLFKWGVTQTSDSELKRTKALVWFVSGGVPKSFTNTTRLRSSDGSLSGFNTGAQRLCSSAGTSKTSSTCHNTIKQAFACCVAAFRRYKQKIQWPLQFVRATHTRHGRRQGSRGTRLKGRRGSKPCNTFHKDARNKDKPSRIESSTTHIERRDHARFGIGTIYRMFSSQPTTGLLLWGHAFVFRRVRDDSRSHNQVDGTKTVQDHSAPGAATGCWQGSL